MRLGPDGNLNIADTGCHRISKLTRNGETLAEWGLERLPPGYWGDTSKEPGSFSRPSALAIAADGTIYVAAAFNDRIQRFIPVSSSSG